jgi:dsDNA-specific endonuclease/ATPase MutS2
MKLSDLWVGDNVLLLKSNRYGKIISIHKDGIVNVRLNDGISVKTKAGNLKVIDEGDSNDLNEVDEWLKNLESQQKQTKSKSNNFQTTLDLHFEKLDIDDKIVTQGNILDLQLDIFKTWLDEATRRRKRIITVIHGKGTGTLKAYLISYLKNDPRISLINSTNEGGALEIFLK